MRKKGKYTKMDAIQRMKNVRALYPDHPPEHIYRMTYSDKGKEVTIELTGEQLDNHK